MNYHLMQKLVANLLAQNEKLEAELRDCKNETKEYEKGRAYWENQCEEARAQLINLEEATDNIRRDASYWKQQYENVRPYIDSLSAKRYQDLCAKADSDERCIKAIEQCRIDNRKLDAIKLIREFTGMGLKEAKDYVESKPGIITFGVVKV